MNKGFEYEKEAGDRQETQGQLQSEEACYRLALENSDDIVMEYQIQNDAIYFTTELAMELYEVPRYFMDAPEQLLDRGVVLPESKAPFLEIFENIKLGHSKTGCLIRTQTKTGEIRWNRIAFTTIFSAEGLPIGAAGILKDITAQKTVEIQYENAMLYRNTMEQDALLSYEADLTNLIVLRGLESVLGEELEDGPVGYLKALRQVTEKIVYPEDKAVVYAALDPDYLKGLYSKGISKVEMEYRRCTRDGGSSWVRGTVYITEDRQLECMKALYYIYDIDADKQAMLALREKAEQDLLTGIYNKVTTEQMIQKALTHPIGNGRMSVLFVIDLDNFKEINDHLGHAYGDAVLSEIAQNLKTLCRREDIVGRIGGDEFAIFLRDLPDMRSVEKKAGLICDIFHQNHWEEGALVNISATVGGAVFPTHGNEFEVLYNKADLALYEAKKRGKDIYCIYNEIMQDIEFSGFDRETMEQSTGKTFAENIIEYVFQILYQSQDLDLAIHGIMELLTKHFGFNRSYLYEYDQKDSVCKMVSEWYQNGMTAIPEPKRIIGEEELAVLRFRFEKGGFCFMGQEEGFGQEEQKDQGDSSFTGHFRYALMSGGDFQGFIGFDRLERDRNPELSEFSVLKEVAQILDVFLAQRRTNIQLEETGFMLQTISDNMRTCTYIIDPKTHILQFVNRNTSDTIPLAKPGVCCYEAIRGEEVPCKDCPIDYMVEASLPCHHTEMYLPPYRMWASIDTRMVRLADGRDYALFNGYDFKEYKNMKNEYIVNVEAFTKDEALYRALSASTDDYIYICDMTKNLFYFPDAMVEEFDLPGQIIENAVPVWGSYLHPNEQPAFYQDIQNLLDGTSNYHNQEYRARNRHGEWVWLRCRGYVTRDEKGNPMLFSGLISNLQKKGKIDHISGLPNKFEFERQVRGAISEDQAGMRLLLLGLDDFKHVNSLYGWEFGDWVLRDLAKQMQALLPYHLTVCRMDGDKFGIFITKNDEIGVEQVYQILHKAFQVQQEYKGNRYYCMISGGCSSSETHDYNALLKEAEYALEYSKEEGKNRLCQYDSGLMSQKDRMFVLIERLRESVEHGFENFEVYYQPQVDASSQSLIGAEALLRWHCQEYGVVSPLEFIPLLEQSGMIHVVGYWVLCQAADTCEQWKVCRPDFMMSVNVSYLQIKEGNFLKTVTELVEAGRICSRSMNLELTESCIVAQDTEITGTFQQLRNMGFRIALDDFGTGYSSLAILKNAPADVVKLDRYFVKDIIHSNFDAAFIQTVVTLCHSVGISVCLEGVETWEEYHLVQGMDLDVIQGYLFGRPQKREEFEDQFLNRQE